MANYTFAQLEQLWISAGGSTALAPLMAGVAIVESSGNPDAYNASGASGLWQIEIPLHSNLVPGGAANVFNPADNAKAAVALSGNTMAGITANWLAFEPTGAAQAIANANGATLTSTTTGSSTGTSTASSGGSGGTSTWGLIWDAISSEFPFLGEVVSGYKGTASTIGDVATSISGLTSDFSTAIKLISWLFVPSHWLRIIAFFAGVMFLGGGIYMFKEAM
jgi:hypothetical protein